MEDIKEYELLPNAKMLLASLRSVGYTEETSIADIVDNSISAEATKIELYFDWDSKSIIIADNGKGMSEYDLLESMQIGSADPNEYRTEKDLGRFGMGMKTASFSLGKSLNVISKVDNNYFNVEWDLDYVEETNKWNILIKNNAETMKVMNDIKDKVSFDNYPNGTLIIISKMDRLIDFSNLQKSKEKFYKAIKKVKKHLMMIFHRFMEEDDLEILVNMQPIMPWNPYVRYNVATQELPIEECFDGKCQVTIEPYILPHKTKFANEDEYDIAAGPKGWINHQGFYVYRNRRLIVYGTWFGKFKKEPAYNLARIKLDVNSESDFEWGIDIKKSKAVPPVGIEESITQIAYLAIERSVAVYNSRGTYNKKNNGNNTNLKYVWEQRKNSVGNYMFYLNKKHPMLLKIMQDINNELKAELKTYLSLVENYSPSMLSGVIDASSMETKADDEQAMKDIILVKEKIAILKKLNYENEEIYDALSESPEYSYLKGQLMGIIEGV